MKKLNKFDSDVKNIDCNVLNSPSNMSDRGKNKMFRWVIYSYNGNTVSVHTDPNNISDHMNQSNAESIKSDHDGPFVSNILDIIKITKNKSNNDIQKIIEKALCLSDRDQANVTIERNECSRNNFNNVIDNNSTFSDPFEIVERRKYSKLTAEQITFLKSQLSKNGNKSSTISRIYGVSPSTLSRIKNMDERILEKLPRRRLAKVNQKELTFIIESIEEYYWKQEYPFTINDVLEHLKETNGIDYPYQLIQRIIKDNIRLTYKRVLSRPITADIPRVKLQRKLFSIQTIQAINSKILIANCDEWTLNRNTKLNYSWSRVGSNKETKNSWLIGSISIIMTIFSNGCWFVMMTKSTTTSEVFIHFMTKMNEWLNKNNMFNYECLHLHLDNCPYHKSKETINYLRKTKLKVYFLPPYSPSLAPIELAFGLIKRKLKRKSKGSKLYLHSKDAFDKIFDVLNDMDRQIILKLFRKFYKELKINLQIQA